MSPGSEGEGIDYCPIAATLDLLTGKWTLHILRELMDGRKRFNEMSRALGCCSSRTLCARLRALEEEGIVVREVKHTIPPWVEYELTEKGQALNAVIDSIVLWGNRYMLDRCASGWQHTVAGEPPEVESASGCCVEEVVEE